MLSRPAMIGSVCLGFLRAALALHLLNPAWGLSFVEDKGDVGDDEQLNKAILEMLNINKLSAHHQTKPHPYMRQIYQLLDTQAQDSGDSDGTLVQSLRSVLGLDHAPPGWIWFNVTQLQASMLVGELVLFRKTLHPRPLSITVTVHGLASSCLMESAPLDQRHLTLDQRPASGYDVFDVSAALAVKPPAEMLGFQLRYTDESGSLVLHEALTQSLYSLDRGSLSEPLLVLYQTHPLRP